jgi:hypothetical protein
MTDFDDLVNNQVESIDQDQNEYMQFDDYDQDDLNEEEEN